MNGEGDFYRAGSFRLFVKPYCTDTHAMLDYLPRSPVHSPTPMPRTATVTSDASLFSSRQLNKKIP
jgi:hypothetical protein